MRADISRWDEKYRPSNPNPSFDPEPLLTDYNTLLKPGGRSLDIACGVGQNTLCLARSGYESYAVDGSLVGLRYLKERASETGLNIYPFAADLDQWTPPADTFDLIVVIRFLNRTLFPAIIDSLRPGGVLIYKTLNLNFLRLRPDTRPEYLLRPGEFSRAFSSLAMVATDEGEEGESCTTFFIGTRPLTN